MLAEELGFIERIGIGAFAFILVYLLLKAMIARNFLQADMILDMAKNTIKENTEALEKMQEALIQHLKQKEIMIENMTHCKKERDVQIKELLKRK